LASTSVTIQVVVEEERLCHRAGIGETCRLDHDVVEAVATLHELAQHADQIAAHRAADTAVGGFEDLLFGPDHELMVDAHFAELVLDDGNTLAVSFGENPVEQRRLARAQKSGEHRDRDTALRRHRISLHSASFNTTCQNARLRHGTGRGGIAR
jgi:hypothetical protein